MRTVQVIPIVVGSLESVTKNLDKWLEKLDKELVFHCLKNYATRNRKDFKESFVVTWERI